MIKNFPVIDEDVKIAEQICGPYMVSLKGNITRHNLKPVQDYNIERPPEIREIHTDIIFCIHIIYVNVMPFINGTETTINYRSIEPLSNMYADKLYQVLDACIHVYNHASHTVTEI